jgi:alpha-glucosidase
MPWSAAGPGHGFTTGRPWLPFDEQARTRAVDRQAADETSTLTFYRSALAARRRLLPSLGSDVRWEDAPTQCVALSRPCGDGRLHVLTNFADEACRVPVASGAVLELASAPGVTLGTDAVELPAACTAWLRTGQTELRDASASSSNAVTSDGSVASAGR